MSGYLAIKAVEGEQGEWLMDVLAIPFGSPDNRDADGEWFDEETEIYEAHFPTPPPVYYHGSDENGPMAEPQIMGRFVKRWTDAAGHWVRYSLDKGNAYAKRVWEAAMRGVARASSGTIGHLVRKGTDGHILRWPFGETSIFEADTGKRPANKYAVALPVMKALYDAAGMSLPPDIDVPEATPEADEAAVAERNTRSKNVKGAMKMAENEKTIAEVVAEQVAVALKAEKERGEAEARQSAAIKAAQDEAVKAARAEWEKSAAEAGRLFTYDEMPYVKRFHDEPYDNVDADGLALMIGVMTSAGRPVREDAYKALGLRLESAEEKGSEASQLALKALKALTRGQKANEIHYSTLTDHGDEWVGVQYSNRLWEKVRASTVVAARIPQIEVPQGAESIIVPLESTDPTWYKVSQAASLPTTEATGWPNATITSSQITTDNQTITLSKAGARALWTGEMNEDSLIPFLPQLQAQLTRSGAETLDHVVIDGDTDTTASTNINDIAGTPAGTEAFLLADGFRKLALVTNTANMRDGGVLTVEDFLETAWLMGDAGLNGADPTKVSFIIDPNTMKKAMQLAEVKTKDVSAQATVENGRLTGLWGYEIVPSWFMHKGSTVRKANTAGKVDIDTTSNNSTGSILAVRWDQWMFGWRRRMTMETTRIARADTYEIVALMRFGLKNRDNEASAISYDLTV